MKTVIQGLVNIIRKLPPTCFSHLPMVLWLKSVETGKTSIRQSQGHTVFVCFPLAR